MVQCSSVVCLFYATILFGYVLSPAISTLFHSHIQRTANMHKIIISILSFLKCHKKRIQMNNNNNRKKFETKRMKRNYENVWVEKNVMQNRFVSQIYITMWFATKRSLLLCCILTGFFCFSLCQTLLMRAPQAFGLLYSMFMAVLRSHKYCLMRLTSYM